MSIAFISGAGASGLLIDKGSIAVPQTSIFVSSIIFSVAFIMHGNKSKRKSKVAVRSEENSSQFVKIYGTDEDVLSVIREVDEDYL